MVSDNVNRIKFAFLFAKLAAYAACRTKILCDLARILGTACNMHTVNVRKDIDELLRAGFCAHSAAYAYVSVYLRKAVAYRDRMIRTSLFAIAEAYAAVFAGIRASEECLYCCAGLKPLIVHFCMDLIAKTGASYVCDLLDYVLGLDA